MIAVLGFVLFAASGQYTPPQAGTQQDMEAAVKAQPTAPNWQRLGLSYFLSSNFTQAIPAFTEAVRLDPKLWPSRLFLGICLYRTNRFAEALSSLTTARKEAPANAQGSDDVDYWLGTTQIALNRPWDGMRQLESLLKRNPEHREALATLARCYSDVAGSLWNNVAERTFNTPPGQEVHGHVLLSEGNRVSALKAFRDAQNLAPHRAGPGREVGRILLEEGQTSEALAALEAEHKLAPRDVETAYITGLALVQSNRLAEALPLLKQAAPWNVSGSESSIALAQLLLALGRAKEAESWARHALSIDPHSPAASDLLKAALAQTKASAPR